MPLRIIFAFVLTFFSYLLFALATEFDGFETIIGQSIMAIIFSILYVIVTIILGLPLFHPKLWSWWSKMWWLSIAIAMLGIISILISNLPSLQMTLTHPETKQQFQSPNGYLVYGGWLVITFSIVWCPLISIRNLKKRLSNSPAT